MRSQKLESNKESTIDPQYVPPWDDYVEALLSRQIGEDARFRFVEQLLVEFDVGMSAYQSEQSLVWMETCLERTGLTKADASVRLEVDRAHVGRWLTGENDLPFRRFQRFYVFIGLQADIGSPLKDRESLHLGGYLRALPFVRSTISHDADCPKSQLDLESLLCLYHFYANMDPLKGLMESDAKRPQIPRQILVDTLETVHCYLPAERTRVRTVKDLAAILTEWGTPWLICLRLLAEEVDGITPHFVTAGRPIRLTEVLKGQNVKR